jgi:hypothetical protein
MELINMSVKIKQAVQQATGDYVRALEYFDEIISVNRNKKAKYISMGIRQSQIPNNVKQSSAYVNLAEKIQSDTDKLAKSAYEKGYLGIANAKNSIEKNKQIDAMEIAVGLIYNKGTEKILSLCAQILESRG